MIKTYRPYSVDDGHSRYANGEIFNAEATGVLIAVNGAATTRFRGIDIPRGSTINSATLRIPFRAKNNVASQMQYRVWWMTTGQINGTLASYSYPEPSYYGAYQSGQYRVADRAEGDTSDAGNWITINLLTEFSSFKSYMESSNWTMHDSITFSLVCNYIYHGSPDIHFTGQADAWSLTIDWTPPATPTRTEIMNHAVNPHAQYSQDYYNPWHSNPALGNYDASTTTRNTNLPNRTTGVSDVSTGWQTTWPTTKKSWVNHWAFNRLDFGKWYTFSAWCYVPTGAPDIIIDFLFQTVSEPVSIKNQWFRISHKFLNTIAANSVFVGLATEVAATTTGPHLYFTKVMFTEGEEQPEYFGGSINNNTVGTAQYTGAGEETRLYVNTLAKPTLTAPSSTSTDDPSGNLSWTNGGTNHKVTIKRSS